MQRVIADITMSLDGYVAGPNVDVSRPLGEGGELLHRWQYAAASWREGQGQMGGEATSESDIIAESSARAGAFVMGRRMFDTGVGPWGETPPFRRPVFVLTHHPLADLVREGGTTFTFLSDGIEHAIRLASAAAGEKDVAIAGGASAIRQAIDARLLDELQVHIAPILLGGGTRLFEAGGRAGIELEPTRVVAGRRAAHLAFVLKR